MAINDGLTHYWSGQDTVDRIGDTTVDLFGNATPTVEGFDFPDVNSYADITAPGAFPGTGDFTVSYWYKLVSQINTNWDCIATRPLGASGTVPGWVIGRSGTTANFVFQIDTGSVFTSASKSFYTPTTGEWTYLCGVVNTGNVKAYVDTNGELSSEDLVVADYATGSPMRLNGRPGTADRRTACMIADVRIYVGRALVIADRDELRTNGPFYMQPPLPSGGPPPVHPLSGFGHPLRRPGAMQ